MRQLILDTETTGLDHRQGHRVIEIAAVELNDRRPTGRHLHLYLNPERDIDPAATEVHGMTLEMLQDKPRFRDVAVQFVEFARGAQWVIHNAPFDVGFLDAELSLCGHGCCHELCGGAENVIDTLALARETFPGKRNSLDALCERFGIDNAHRTLHGALLDAQLLAEVYLAMTRGQETLTIDMAPASRLPASQGLDAARGSPRPVLLVVEPTEQEFEAHRAYLEALDQSSKGRCLWLALEHQQAAA